MARLYRFPFARTLLTPYALTTRELRCGGRGECQEVVVGSEFWDDAYTAAVAESTSVAGSVASQLDATATLSASPALAEALSALLAGQVLLSASASASASVSAQMALLVALSEVLSLLAEVVAIQSGGSLLAESTSVSASVAALLDARPSLAASVALLEAVAALFDARPDLAASLGLVGQAAAQLGASVALLASLSTGEAVAAQRDVPVALGETADLLEALAARLDAYAPLDETADLVELLAASRGQSVAVAESWPALLEALWQIVFSARGRRRLVESQPRREVAEAQGRHTLTEAQPRRETAPMSASIFASELGQVDYTITEDGAAVDLTGLDVSVIAVHRQSRVRDERAVTVLSAVDGTVRAVWPPGTLEPGKYDVQLKVAPPGGDPNFWPRPGYVELWVQAGL